MTTPPFGHPSPEGNLKHKMKKLLIIDGNSIVNRAFYGVRPLSVLDSDGKEIHTNAVYGFLNILLKYLNECEPDYVCVAFDVHAPTFRHKMFADYKAHRKPSPPELHPQFPLVKEILAALNIKMLELAGYEADDIIGTVAKMCESRGVCCDILTGDKDDLQLVSDSVTVKLVVTRGGKTETTDYNANAVLEQYGVTPAEFIDVKALMGDSSDNIPGVAGIGEKTAFSLIQQYKNIEYIFENLDKLSLSAGVLAKLEAGRELAELSKTLATIDVNVPIELELNHAEYNPNFESEELAKILTRLNFKQFLDRFGLEKTPPSVAATPETNEQMSFF